jgi:phosphopantothenoylcysteine decarboxylase/phosphopantothenate--cysteine ligase
MQRVVITAGGTEVPLDDVRRLTNSSSGDFGLLLAREFANAGIQVTFVCTPRASEKMTRYDSFDVKEFVTFDDLSRVLEETLKTLTPDFVFHAAAVMICSPQIVPE